jgi:AcrR family transcriptional regulator
MGGDNDSVATTRRQIADDALDAAVQVLRTEGAARFTTARVAERAGVSVGSLYQYFPNKAAILFCLQADEWRQTSELLRNVLENGSQPPTERLRMLVHGFLRSECEEAEIRTALGDAAPLYRDAPEADAARASGSLVIRDCLEETLPGVDARAIALAADLIKATLTQVGSSFSETEGKRTPATANLIRERRQIRAEHVRHRARIRRDLFVRPLRDLRCRRRKDRETTSECRTQLGAQKNE